MSGEDNTPENNPRPAGIDHLVTRGTQKNYNPFYSRIVRWMRLALPLAALSITAVVFTWSQPRQNLLTQNAPEIKKTVGKNELVAPRFENTDSQGRPYSMTASRAVQDDKDGDIIILEKPVADMTLEDNHWVAMEATEGVFQQKERKLLLRGIVRFYHDGGYELETPELHIDITNSTASTDKDVHAQGPAGTLDAKGLEGSNETGTLVFKGPVKLVLNTDMMGRKSGGLLQ